MPDSSIEREASADKLIAFLVRRAYRKKALETHPDKLDPGAGEGEKQKAEREFHKVRKLVHEAFEVLSDAKDALAKVEREAEMLAQMVKEMHQSNPEFAARRQAALQVCSSTPFIGGYTKRDTFTPAPPIHIHTRTFTSPKIHTPALIFILPPVHSHSPDPLDSHSAHVFN
ncbi:hypothetical protein CPB84DRAFT_1765813 [Gymnopilus junonius]|uniref:J domain-containing protein n=1 Tax=Gymnopilus junonius TaxID=109634 RepID=A0A9P5NUP3_GYMJU|nr:hypothetical protein CPB84DRAFT_1765813 [Gymnopilus junonius]